jgi:hypothetical protein
MHSHSTCTCCPRARASFSGHDAFSAENNCKTWFYFTGRTSRVYFRAVLLKKMEPSVRNKKKKHPKHTTCTHAYARKDGKHQHVPICARIADWPDGRSASHLSSISKESAVRGRSEQLPSLNCSAANPPMRSSTVSLTTLSRPKGINGRVSVRLGSRMRGGFEALQAHGVRTQLDNPTYSPTKHASAHQNEPMEAKNTAAGRR